MQNTQLLKDCALDTCYAVTPTSKVEVITNDVNSIVVLATDEAGDARVVQVRFVDDMYFVSESDCDGYVNRDVFYSIREACQKIAFSFKV